MKNHEIESEEKWQNVLRDCFLCKAAHKCCSRFLLEHRDWQHVPSGDSEHPGYVVFYIIHVCAEEEISTEPLHSVHVRHTHTHYCSPALLLPSLIILRLVFKNFSTYSSCHGSDSSAKCSVLGRWSISRGREYFPLYVQELKLSKMRWANLSLSS